MHNTLIDLPRKGIIKDRVIIASYCQIWTYGSFYEKNINQDPKYGENFGEVIIEEGVIIYSGVVIMHGEKIGKFASIGANSLINKDVDANTFVGGVPARIIEDKRNETN